MFKQIGFAAAMLAAAAVVPGAADAQRWQGDRATYQQIDQRDYDRAGYDRGGYERGDPRRGYDDRGYGRGPGSGYDRRGYRGRGRCDKGTGGTIIGAIAGGLLGNSVAGRGDRGVGTIVGAGVGALAGRAIDRDC